MRNTKAARTAPAGFTPYYSRRGSPVGEMREPAVALTKQFLILNPALIKRVPGRNYAVLYWAEEEQEIGVWFFRNRVPGAEKVAGKSGAGLCKYLSFRGFRGKFLDGNGVGDAPLIRVAAQDKENAEFFRFSLKEPQR